MAYEQGEIRDSANNIILAGSWGIKTPFKDIVNILAENGRALKADGITAAASVPWTGITGKPTTLAGYGITDAYTKDDGDAKYAPSGYGLGTYVASTTGDANTMKTTGFFYMAAGSTNIPYTYGHLFVQSISTSYAVQTFQPPVSGSAVIYIRACYGGTWTSWKQIASTDMSYTKTEGDAKYAPSGYGLGTASKHLGTGIDLNTVTINGMYYIYGPVNGPITLQACYLFVQAYTSTYMQQTCYDVASPTIWQRTIYNGVWSTWKQLAFTDSPTFTGNVGVVSSGVAIGDSFSTNFKIQTPTLKGMRLGYNPTNNNAVIAPIENQSNALDIAFYDATSGTMLPKATFLSTGFVGIGDTNPSRMLTISNSFGSTGTLLAYNTNSSYTGVVGQFKTEATANATILRCDSGATTGVFSVFANGIVSTAGQIKFPITQNASTDPNTMDDYEEGTFTPYVYGTTTAGTATYAIQVGKYTKIGNTVNFLIVLAYSEHTGTGSMQVGGLPFVVTNASQACSLMTSGLTYSGQLAAIVASSSTAVILYQIAASTTTVPVDTNVGSLYLSGTYLV